MPESVRQGSQFGTPVLTAAPQGSGRLADPQAVLGCQGDHLRGEFHAAAVEGELFCGFCRQPPEAAVEIPDICMETLPRQEGEHPHAPDMTPGHRAFFHSTGESVSDYYIIFPRQKGSTK